MSKEETNETNEQLLKRLEDLKQAEEDINQQIEELRNAGVNEKSNEEVMQALHDYNEIKDAVNTVFSFLGRLTKQTSEELHTKYNIPPE